MTTAPYLARLQAPQACDHLVQLYTDEAFLGRVVGEFLGAGLVNGEAAIVIATPGHVALFRERLDAAGVDPSAAVAAGRLVELDAEECLSRFMVDGRPDRHRFLGLVRPLLDGMVERGHARTRLYGEMVDLLWSRSMPATLALEELWNGVLAETGMSLLCGYRIDNFDPRAHRGVLQQVAAPHSELIAVEDYERLESAVARAYEDVFGHAGDADLLREHIASEFTVGRTRMPVSLAALLGLRGVAPAVAESVIDRARYHYHE